MHLSLTAASTALFSTWVFVENQGVLFDAGDGVSASLGLKSGKVRDVFVTHADRDHLCGLLQFNQLNAKDGQPRIHYPKDCGSFPALQDFVTRFDPQSGPATWRGLTPGERVDVGNDHHVEARASEHVRVEGQVKALDYTLCVVRRSLRPEFRGLPGSEIASLRKQHGEDAITAERIDRLLGYSGDAPQLDPEHWSGVDVLIHEATFLEPETTRGAHANLPQVVRAAATLDLKALVLLHFSARYKRAEIEAAIVEHAQAAQPCFPIHAVYPGQVATDILSSKPVWSPNA